MKTITHFLSSLNKPQVYKSSQQMIWAEKVCEYSPMGSGLHLLQRFFLFPLNCDVQVL